MLAHVNGSTGPFKLHGSWRGLIWVSTTRIIKLSADVLISIFFFIHISLQAELEAVKKRGSDFSHHPKHRTVTILYTDLYMPHYSYQHSIVFPAVTTQNMRYWNIFHFEEEKTNKQVTITTTTSRQNNTPKPNHTNAHLEKNTNCFSINIILFLLAESVLTWN